MSRFFDDKVLSDDQIYEESCKNGQVSPESRYNDYRNRLPFHYIEDGENDGYYYWTYGATMELSIILSDDVAWGEDQPAPGIEVDDKLSETSENPVQNKVITEALNGKLDKSTEKTILDQAYIKTAAGDNSRLNISIEQLPLTLVERDVHGHVMTSKADSEGQAVAYEQLEQRVPAGGRKGQNLTKKSDSDYDTYWADPDDINSIEHITLNGEEVPIDDKTANIKVDAKTIGFESTNVAYTDKENTFTEPQTFSYVNSDDPNWSEYGELGGSGANYSYTEYTDDTHKYFTSGEAFISSLVGRISVNRSTNDNSGTSKRSLTLDVNKNWIARTETNAERVDGKLGTAVQTYYAYKFPKTYPNKEVTLATIEDLTAQFGALNIKNGTGDKSLQQEFDPKYNGVVKAASKNPYAKVLYPELTDAEPLGAIGDYSASFGGNSSVQAKRGIGGGTSSVTKGAYSQSLGDNTVTTPKASDSTAIGYQTTTDAPCGFTHGAFTVVMSQKYIEGMFDPSVEPGQGGSGQPTEPGTTPVDTLEMDTRRGEAASAGGFNSYASGFAAEVDGVSNVADGHISKSSGRSNRSWSYLSKTDGKNSVVKPDQTNENATGEGSWANGDNIQIIGAKYAYSGGKNNSVFTGADNSFSYGEGLQVRGKNQTVIGQYNDNNPDNIFEIGTGTSDLRKTSFRATRDGRVYYGDFEVSNLETTNAAIAGLDNKLSPKINSNIDEITNLWATLRETNTNLNRLNEQKYDKTGGTIDGQVVITGDLTVNGTQHINDTENLAVKNAMIYSNSDGATLALLGGLGIKKNATDIYGIVYDRTSDSVKLGLGKSDTNGVFTFNENEGQPVAIRDDSSKFTNNNLVKWDSENLKLVDAGKNVENLVDKLPDLLRSQAYVRNANGEDSGLAYTYTDEGNTLALRNASGQLQVSDPSQDKDAANKSYADNLNARYVSTSILGG